MCASNKLQQAKFGKHSGLGCADSW